jgi:WD40 repeat protein
LSVKPADVHRTLSYSSNLLTWRLLWLPLLLLAACAYLALYEPSTRMRIELWLGLGLGTGWLIYATIRRAIPPPPMLVLSPQGLVWRNVSPHVIPWTTIKDVTATDHTVRHRGSKVTYENVTVVWVPRRYYNTTIFDRSLLTRGPYWANNFIHEDELTGICIAHHMLSVQPEPLRAEIVARWQAFSGMAQQDAVAPAQQRTAEPAAPLPEAAPSPPALPRREPLADYGVVVRDWAKYAAIALLFVVAGWALSYSVTSMRTARHDAAIAGLEETKRSFERMEAEDKARREASEAREKWRHSQPGSTPPEQKAPAIGHVKDVTVLAVLPGGRTFISGDSGGAIKLWDTESGRVLRDIGQHDGSVRALHVLPDGAHLLSGGTDGKVVVRTLDDGGVVQMFDASEHGMLAWVAMSADGRRAFSTHLGSTYVRSVGILWDLEARKGLKLTPGAGMQSGAIAADGVLAVTGAHDGTLWLWDAMAGSLRSSLGAHSCCAQRVTFMPGDRRVASAGGDGVRLWDVASNTEVLSFQGHEGLVTHLVVSADGKRIVSGSFDRTARLWDVDTGRELARFDTGNIVYATAFLRDDAILVASGRSIHLWIPGRSEPMRVFAGAEAR